MSEKRKTYSKEFKIKVVKDYLSGKSGGIHQIAKKYGIAKGYTVSLWAREYEKRGENAFEKIYRRKLPKRELTDKEKIEYLESENAYLRKLVEEQENILKKKKSS